MSHAHLFRLCALVVLLVMLGASALLWPIPALGFDVSLRTGLVQAARPGSPAAQMGIQPGDRIVRIYGYDWEAINTRLLLLPLPWQPGTPTPITLVRNGQWHELVLRAGAPTWEFQVEKALRVGIALACWGTGYLLGTSPRATDRRLRWTAWFWLLLGGSLGLYQLTHLISYPLTISVLWVQCTILAPVAVAIHQWYPQRPTTPAALRRNGQFLLGAILVAQLSALTLVLVSPTLTVVYERFESAASVAYLASFVLSAAALWRAYQETQVAHIRRQIRLIGAACVLVGCWWALLLLIQWGSPSLFALLPAAALPFGAILIPLAYLLGGVSVDLMRLDQLVRRILVHALTGLTILSILIIGAQRGLLILTPALSILAGLVLYAPCFRLIQRWVVPGAREARVYAALREAGQQLGTSLEATRLMAFLSAGIKRAYLNPPLAIYHRDDPDSVTLVRVVAKRLDAPALIPGAILDPWQQQGTQLLKASALQERLGQQPLDPAIAGLVFHPTVALWGIMRQQQGQLLGLILLGPRGDDDPYQPDELRELEQLLGTAALALTNSASYDAQVAAAATIRALYRHAQQIEERTAAEIANEIHDEVLNIHVRVNMDMLAQLTQEVPDPLIQERLNLVLAGEEAISQMLRLVCEQLKPTGIDDPLGLPASLRQQTTRAQARWGVPTTLVLEHQPVPLSEQVHRALVRITREALTNAVKHGRPTRIAVVLRFPPTPADPLVITVQNDGARPAAGGAAHPWALGRAEYAGVYRGGGRDDPLDASGDGRHLCACGGPGGGTHARAGACAAAGRA